MIDNLILVLSVKIKQYEQVSFITVTIKGKLFLLNCPRKVLLIKFKNNIKLRCKRYIYFSTVEFYSFV